MRSFVLADARKCEFYGMFNSIRQLIGEEATALLIDKYAYGTLYIPVKLNSKHPLCQLLGEETACKLSSVFAGLTVEIPSAAASKKSQRNRLILADLAAGMNHVELARKYQLTTRTIREITRLTNN